MSHSPEIQANLERADTSLQAAKTLLSAGFFNDAASRAYYATFHGASALLLSKNLTFGSHTGVLRAISLHFVKTGILDRNFGRDLNWLAELRQVADYGELKNVSKSDADLAVETADRFLIKIHQLLNKNF